MKRVLLFILALVSALSFGFVIPNKKEASAASFSNYNDFNTEVNTIIANFVKFKDRVAGSETERNAAKYIKEYLDGTAFEPLDDGHTVDGVQTFMFESTISGKYETSQNIIYTKKASKETDKKIILTCKYDAIAFEYNEEKGVNDVVDTEGVNGSAGSVALMLILASHLGDMNFDFNIELCFFGAGESDNAGASIYTQGLNKDNNKDILCAINFDTIALGKNVYYYVDEISTPVTKYLNKTAKEDKLGVKELDLVHLNKSIISASTSKLGLSYTHIGIQSANVEFMKQGIVSINFIAGEYDEGIVLGRSEFAGNDVLTYTKDDSAEKIEELYGFESVVENLFTTFKVMNNILTDFDFQTALSDSFESTKVFYSIFGNQKLATYLTAIAFVVFVIVAMGIYYKLNIKSYYSNVEIEFLTSVIKIAEQVDKEGKDENVSKVISQVIAQDIKKNKTIKTKRKKHKD